MNRRRFFQAAGLTVGTLGVASYAGIRSVGAKISPNADFSLLPNGSKSWRNWSENQQCTPKEFFLPNSEDELIKKLKTSSDKMRMLGGGHSFSGIVPTNNILMSIKNLKGIISHDAQKHTATVQAGTHLYELTDELLGLGYSLINQGDINRQSVAGAVNTSTHGTGKDLTSVSGMVKGFRLLTANGEIIDCTAETNADLFYGGVVGLGALGVVTQYTLQLMPKYKLHEHIYPADVEDILGNFDKYLSENRHFEAWIFAHSDKCLAKKLNITEKEIMPLATPFPNDDQLLALGLTLSGESASRMKQVMNVMEDMLEATERIGWAQEIFPSMRNVKFNEMEYELPAENGVACMRELIETTRKQDIPLFFPFEIRYVKEDNFWMSPFYQQNSIAISCHQFNQYGHEKIFKIFHEIMKKHGGRMHWGKLNYFTKEETQKLFPKYSDFVKLRNELDPENRFSNDYIQHYFS